jgi:hypothetical protein
VSVWAFAGIIRHQNNPSDLDILVVPPSQKLIDWASFGMVFISCVNAVSLIFAVLTRKNPDANYYLSPATVHTKKYA